MKLSDLLEIGRIGKFAVVGLAATGVHATAYVTILSTTGLVSALGANTIAFLFAVGVSYVGHSQWTFADRSAFSGGEFIRWVLLSGTAFLLNSAFVYLLVDVLGMHYTAALVPMLLVVPTVTYLLARLKVFVDL